MYRQLAIALIALGVAGTAHAQALGAQPLTLLISPQYPSPYETVTVTPQSTLTNLAQNKITITVNGEVIASGSGSIRGTFTMGGPGSSASIQVEAVSPDGDFTANAVLHAAAVSLIEEPNATTHPFYEGAPQVAINGIVRLVAQADLRASAGSAPVSAANLVYNWKVEDQILQDSSGIGKSTLILEAPDEYRNETVSVTVTTEDGSLSGSASTIITPVDPTMLFYKDGPLLGPEYDVALGSTYSMQGDEESFIAVPYFFSTAPLLTWNVNGTPSVSDPVITLRPTGTGAGSAAVSANANVKDSYIGTSQLMTINFGSGQSHSIFSL